MEVNTSELNRSSLRSTVTRLSVKYCLYALVSVSIIRAVSSHLLNFGENTITAITYGLMLGFICLALSQMEKVIATYIRE